MLEDFHEFHTLLGNQNGQGVGLPVHAHYFHAPLSGRVRQLEPYTPNSMNHKTEPSEPAYLKPEPCTPKSTSTTLSPKTPRPLGYYRHTEPKPNNLAEYVQAAVSRPMASPSTEARRSSLSL